MTRSLYNIFTRQLSSKAHSFTKTTPTQQTDLHRLVHEFKSSCDIKRFRQNKGNFRRSVRSLAAANQPSLIEEILEHQKNYVDIRKEGFAIRLIELYGESGMLGHARKVFDELPKLRCPRTVMSFNALLKACVDAKEYDEAVKVFEDLPSRIGVQPDLYSRNTIVLALCEKGSIDEALSRLGEVSDVVSFNTILFALYKRGRFAEGERAWTTMRNYDVAPDVLSYNARLLGMFREDKASEAVFEVLDEMKRRKIRPNLYTYKALIIGFLEKGSPEDAKRWYRKLKKNGFPLNSRDSYSTVVSGFCEAGDLEMAHEVCIDATNEGRALEPGLIEKLVCRLVKKGMIEDMTTREKLV